MKNERYVYISDVRDKKITARSARNKRTHNGKGGSVKFPSDYMTQKEIKAMSGECKSYKLNKPMVWQEFKGMPDDIKVTYIKLIREKFGATDSAIAKMMKTNPCSFSQEMNRLGISTGKHTGGAAKWDKVGFLAWANPVTAEPVEEAHEAVEETAEEVVEVVEEIPVIYEEESKPSIPTEGEMVFEGRIEDILQTIGILLKGADVRININWDVISNG